MTPKFQLKSQKQVPARLNIPVPRELHTKLKTLAETNDTTMEEIIIQAISFALENLDESTP